MSIQHKSSWIDYCVVFLYNLSDKPLVPLFSFNPLAKYEHIPYFEGGFGPRHRYTIYDSCLNKKEVAGRVELSIRRQRLCWVNSAHHLEQAEKWTLVSDSGIACRAKNLLGQARCFIIAVNVLSVSLLEEAAVSSRVESFLNEEYDNDKPKLCDVATALSCLGGR